MITLENYPNDYLYPINFYLINDGIRSRKSSQVDQLCISFKSRVLHSHTEESLWPHNDNDGQCIIIGPVFDFRGTVQLYGPCTILVWQMYAIATLYGR